MVTLVSLQAMDVSGAMEMERWSIMSAVTCVAYLHARDYVMVRAKRRAFGSALLDELTRFRC